MRRPIIAFYIAAAREQILEGQTGFVVGTRDKHSMAEKILLLYGNFKLRLFTVYLFYSLKWIFDGYI